MRVRAIILCAGASSRIGRPKGLLELSGRSFLARIIDEFATAGAAEIVVVLALPHAAQYESAHDLPTSAPLKFVRNPHPEAGPWGSVRLGFESTGASEFDAFAVHPVDIPGVRAADVLALAAGLERAPAMWVAAPSVAGRRAHPVLVRRELAERAPSLPAGSNLRSLIALAPERILHVEIDNPLLAHDVDSDEDYRELLRLSAPS